MARDEQTWRQSSHQPFYRDEQLFVDLRNQLVILDARLGAKTSTRTMTICLVRAPVSRETPVCAGPRFDRIINYMGRLWQLIRDLSSVECSQTEATPSAE